MFLRKGASMGKLSVNQNKGLKALIKANPDDTYAIFQKKWRGPMVSDAYFYYWRRQIHGPSQKHSAANKSYYLKFWEYDSAKITVEAKNMFNSFLDSLRKTRRGNYELIELKDPAVIEVRELQKR